MKKYTLFSLVLISVLIVIVMFNYNKAKQEAPQISSAVSLNILSITPEAIANTPLNFVWQINTSNYVLDSTAIYYGYSSSPSAFSNRVTPTQAGYSFYTDDYIQGRFMTPDSFDANIIFPSRGTVYYRIYAKHGNNNYWSREKSIELD